MRSDQFIYWLQGFFELSETDVLSEKQTETIKNHLKLVFKYEIDPSYSDDPKVIDELQAIHDGKPLYNGTGLGGRPQKGNNKVKC